jgi:5-methylcytosine-specific restriction protein B
LNDYKKAELLQRIKAFNNREAVDRFFIYLEQLKDHLGFADYDNRLVLNVRNDYRKRFSVNLGSLLVLSLSQEHGDLVMQFRITREAFEQMAVEYPMENAFPDSKHPKTLVAGIKLSTLSRQGLPEGIINSWLECCTAVLPVKLRQNVSRDHIPLMWAMIGNSNLYQQIMTEAGTYESSSPDVDHRRRKLIRDYKDRIRRDRNAGEIYKWELLSKQHWNLDAPDFLQMIKSIPFRNLVYPMGIAALHHIAAERGPQLRDAFKQLFDENIELAERLEGFRLETERLYREIEPKLKPHQEERSIATYLTYYAPDKYAFYKWSFYAKYCKLSGIAQAPAGERYQHYLGLLQQFIDGYVRNDSELIELSKSTLPPGSFEDPGLLLLGQDILYTTLDLGERTFISVIEELKELLKDDELLRDFTFGPQKGYAIKGEGETYVWIADAQKVIGNIDAHYEIVIRSDEHKRPAYFVDLHFESSDASNNMRFEHAIGNSLPAGLSWIPWHRKANSIGATKGIAPGADDLVEQLASNLRYLEEQMGDRIRSIIHPANTLSSEKNPLVKHPLNQILYGPPGTGKTYSSITHALAIIDGQSIDHYKDDDRRAEFKARFDSLLVHDWTNPKGQIGFITFHQSMAYEDFIEGIKPLKPDAGDTHVRYDVVPGIFKRMCELAIQKHSSPDFEEAYAAFVNEVRESEGLTLHTPRQRKPFNIRMSEGNSCVITSMNEGATDTTVTKDVVRKYLVDGDIGHWESYIVPIGEYIRSRYSLDIRMDDASQKPFILIIDEINRGNVSQIFGELITLIEEGKRTAQPEALIATLPYSRQTFSVPSNLYIIGTMNTADRSVEALDTALRRRFTFVPMMPEPAKLKGRDIGIDLESMLDTINKRLAVLLDEDRTIGHAWLMGVKDIAGLQDVFATKIIPLLQEFFYHDLGKIGLVLGSSFVKAEPVAQSIFADFKAASDTASSYRGTMKFSIRPQADWRFDTIANNVVAALTSQALENGAGN